MYGSPSRGRGRGRATSRFVNTAPSTPLPPDRDIMEGLHPTPLQTLSIPSVPAHSKNVEITDFSTIGSYNWVKESTPTIIVPGSPPEWKNKATPYQVPPDVGLVFVDQNGFRMPSAVLVPLLIAVDKTSEVAGTSSAFDWSEIDFVTDRNGLRKLLRWIDGPNQADKPKEFRIDMELAGHTVLLNRWEKRTRDNFIGKSYGFNFEQASTTPAPGCEESTGHHRIVKYNLNGLKMVVRFEVDACIPSAKKTKPSATKKTDHSVDDLIESLAGINIATSSSNQKSISSHGLTILEGGTIVPQSSIVEVTTRIERRAAEFNWVDSYPQLFFSQTPHHFLAVHNYGRFTIVNKWKLGSSELQAVEQSIQPSLKKLRVALDTIKDVVVKSGQRGKLTLICKDGELQVFQRVSQRSFLPDDLIARFES